MRRGRPVRSQEVTGDLSFGGGGGVGGALRPPFLGDCRDSFFG